MISASFARYSIYLMLGTLLVSAGLLFAAHLEIEAAEADTKTALADKKTAEANLVTCKDQRRELEAKNKDWVDASKRQSDSIDKLKTDGEAREALVATLTQQAKDVTKPHYTQSEAIRQIPRGYDQCTNLKRIIDEGIKL